MDARQLRKAEDELFARWSESRERFYKDGAGRLFTKQPVRVLFLLKEGNDPSGEFVAAYDIRDLLSEPQSLNTWKNVAQWVALVLDGAGWSEVEYLDRESMLKYLERIAAMNLKKTSGASTAKSPELWKHAVEDSSFILEQIRLYRPHVTVACGTAGYLEAIDPDISVEQSLTSPHRDLGRIVKLRHPSRGSPKKMYDELAQLITPLRKALLNQP